MDKKGVLKNPVTKTELKRVEQTLTEKIDRNSETIDRLIRQVIENTDWIKNKLVTKEEFEKKFNQVLDGQGSMVGILREMKQECVMRGRRIDRIQRV